VCRGCARCLAARPGAGRGPGRTASPPAPQPRRPAVGGRGRAGAARRPAAPRRGRGHRRASRL